MSKDKEVANTAKEQTETIKFYGHLSMSSTELEKRQMISSLKACLNRLVEEVNAKPPYKIEMHEGEPTQAFLDNEFRKQPLEEGAPVEVVFEGPYPNAARSLVLDAKGAMLETILFARICMYVGQPTLVELAEVHTPDMKYPSDNYVKMTYRPLIRVRGVDKKEFDSILKSVTKIEHPRLGAFN